MTIVETVANGLMLAVGAGILGILIYIQRKTRKQRREYYPYVLLYRGAGDAVPLGTFMLQDHAVTALKRAVARNAGGLESGPVPDSAVGGFSRDGMSWRGKDAEGKRIHIWVAKVPEV